MGDKSKIEWTEVGPSLRVRATAAARIGVSLDEYDALLAAGNKWCTGCKDWHDRSAFGADRSRSDGLAAKCLDSRVVAAGRPGARERRLMRTHGAAWCRGCEAWLPVDQVTKNAVCRTHAAAEQRARYAANPTPIKLRVRARERGLDPIPAWWWKEQVAEFFGLCAYGCRRPSSTADHIWPVARGGRSRPSNIVPACRPCNSSKKDNDPRPWIDLGYEGFPAQWDAVIALNFEHGGELDLEGAL